MATGGCEICGDGAGSYFPPLRTESNTALERVSSSVEKGLVGSWFIRLLEAKLAQQSLVTRVAGFIFSINFL